MIEIRSFAISTHTLTWSVTLWVGVVNVKVQISTHTLTWSVTKISLSPMSVQKISTHTLTWSVTLSVYGSANSPYYFNSHAHVERDSDQSESLGSVWNFNSHAHVERDLSFESLDSGLKAISTHTLTWSVTHDVFMSLPSIIISTHTLTWSVTNGLRYILEQAKISTHTLTWSVTIRFRKS